MEEIDFLTVRQAAEEVGMSTDGVRAAMYRGLLAYRVIFDRQVIARADLMTYRATVKMGRPKKVVPCVSPAADDQDVSTKMGSV